MLAPSRDFAAALLGRVGRRPPSRQGLGRRRRRRRRGGPERAAEALRRTAARHAGRGRGARRRRRRLREPLPDGRPSDPVDAHPPPRRARRAVGAPPRSRSKRSQANRSRRRLNVGLQQLAEKSLGQSSSGASLVAVRPSTGEVLAAANNDATDGQPVATSGQVQPGLHLQGRLGPRPAARRPDARLPRRLPAHHHVGGRTYENYDDYPAPPRSHRPADGLRAVVQHRVHRPARQARADRPRRRRPPRWASAPTTTSASRPTSAPSRPGGNTNARAEAIFGQGKDQVSPLAMALVAASVEAGHTVLPTLLNGQQPTSKAEPLTTARRPT